MKSSEIETVLKEIGLPYVYWSYPEHGAPDLPYLVYYYPDGSTEAADNTAWHGVLTVNIELYTAQRSATNEAQVEDVLRKHDLPFTRSETYLNSEHMFEVLYETEVLIDG